MSFLSNNLIKSLFCEGNINSYIQGGKVKRKEYRYSLNKGFPCGSAGKESTCDAGDLGSIPGLGRSLEEGKGYPFQYSGLENSTDCVQSMGLQRVGHH